MNSWKQKVLVLLLGLSLLNPAVAVAQTNSLPQYKNVEGSLSTYLCTPQNDGNDLPRCINRLYRFGVVVGALMLVFFVVWAGYLYITGGETGKMKGKGMIVNCLVGMGLLLGSYALLRFINPDLVAFRAIQPPIFTASDLPSCEDIGYGGEKCLTDGGTVSTSISTGGASGPTAQSCPSKQIVPVGSSFPQRGTWQICKDLLDKLAVVNANIQKSNYDWKRYLGIGQTFQTNTISKSQCHRPDTPKTGTCADIGFGKLSGYPSYPPKGETRSPLTGDFARQYQELCNEINKVGGMIIHNEAADASSCGTFANETHNSGWHLHVILAGS